MDNRITRSKTVMIPQEVANYLRALVLGYQLATGRTDWTEQEIEELKDKLMPNAWQLYNDDLELKKLECGE